MYANIKLKTKSFLYRIRNLENLCILKHDFKYIFNGKKRKIQIGDFTRMKSISISFIGKGNNQVLIGSNCNISGVNFLLSGDGSKIIIGDNVFVNGSKSHPVVINAFEGETIYIGDDCIISNSVEIHTSDYHSLCDMHHNRTNLSRSIYVGNHVWIGLRTVILKGAQVPSYTIIGACSLVTRKFNKSNCLLAGVPAKIIKENVDWDIRLL